VQCLDGLGAETVALKTDLIDAVRNRQIAGCEHVGRQVAIQGGAHAAEGMRADAAELVHKRESP
jgi:hypothetical protein